MKTIFFLIFLFTLLLIPLFANASLLPPCTDKNSPCQTGNYDVCDFLWVISNFTQLILGIVGTAALLFFIYGGFLWITSGGAPGRIQQGQSIMTNTVIGIIIVVFAWVIVNFIISSFAGKTTVIGNKKEWYQVCKITDNSKCVARGEGWDCRNYQDCGLGLKSYKECETNDNCVRFLCPGGNETVCCKLPE